ncbi:MAG: hypothetical protein OHK0012_00600 [Synechococcales cyanobacterium]
MDTVIRPKLLQLWNGFVSAVIVIVAIGIPFHVTFPDRWPEDDGLWDAWLTVIFAIDAWLDIQRIRPRRDFIRHYRQHWLLVDLLSVLPWHWLLATPWLRLLRVVRITRFNRMEPRHTDHFHNLPMKRLLALRWMILIAHWIACGWIILQPPSSLNPFEQYLRALYWTTTTLTSVGYGDIVPENHAQMMYSIVIMIVGAGLYTYIISNLVRLFANGDLIRANFLEKLERTYAFIRYHHLPIPLKKRILDYYDHLWDHQLGFDESLILADLPSPLRSEIALFLKQDILQAAPIFHGASPTLIRELAEALKPMVCLPGEYVFRFGEPGAEMYFISQGSVEILTPQEDQTLAILGAGQFFGELALLDRRRRNASVRALELCRLYVLSHSALDKVLTHFPEFATNLKSIAQRRRDASYPVPPSDPRV